MNKPQLPLLLIDSECSLCVRFEQALKRAVGDKVHTISLYEESLYMHFSELNKDMCLEEIHLITETEAILKGPEAIEYLIGQFPVVKSFSWLIENDMGKKAVDYFYKMTNKYREKLKNFCPECTKDSKKKHFRPDA